MNLKINMLNVVDGDAIIVSIEHNGKDYVVLIDAGEAIYANSVIQKLDTVLDGVGRKAPDLVVVTHYDSDHIGGMPAVLDKYKGSIGVVEGGP